MKRLENKLNKEYKTLGTSLVNSPISTPSRPWYQTVHELLSLDKHTFALNHIFVILYNVWLSKTVNNENKYISHKDNILNIDSQKYAKQALKKNPILQTTILSLIFSHSMYYFASIHNPYVCFYELCYQGRCHPCF